MALSFRGMFLRALIAASTAVIAFTERIGTSLARCLLAVVDALSDPGWASFRRDDLSFDVPGGAALPRSLQEGMRHESAVSRRSAARHI